MDFAAAGGLLVLKALLGNTIAGFAKDVRRIRAKARVYSTWEAAAGRATYEDEDLTEFRARKAEMLLRDKSRGRSHSPGLNYLRLCVLAAPAGDRPVHVVDFGGSFGEEALALIGDTGLPDLRCTVCETPAVVRRAREIAYPEPLAFVSDLAGIRACDIFYSSGALAYVKDHERVLDAAARLGPSFIILVRNSFSEQEIIRLQQSRLFDNGPPVKPEGSFENKRIRYPHHTLDYEATVRLLHERGYELIASFAEESGVYPYGDRVFGRDLIFADRHRHGARDGRA